MLSENTKLFILDNINKIEFLSKEFLIELEEVILFYDNLNNYFKTFDLVNSNLPHLADYDLKDMKITLYYNRLNQVYKEFIKYNEIPDDNLIRKNLFMLHTLLHELTHAYQRELIHMSNTWKNLINPSILILNGKLNIRSNIKVEFIRKIIAKFLYLKNHDIFPVELHADGNAIMIEKDIINNISDGFNYLNYTYFLIKCLLNLYRINNTQIISPLERFNNQMGLQRITDLNGLSNTEKVLFGISDNKNTINETLNEFLDTKRDIDFVKLFVPKYNL